MKRLVVSAALLCVTSIAFAQSKAHRLGLAVGGGTQTYVGDLRQKVEMKDEFVRWAGVVNVGYYLNKSFDIGLFGSLGDYGYCQPSEIANTPVSYELLCAGCIDRVGLGNLSARIMNGGIQLRYKIANGYLLKEDSRLRPYVYAGAAINDASDVMKMNCVKTGNYTSLNAGAGVQYYITERMNIGYQFALGYYTRDDMDFMSHGANDMTRQHNVLLGIDLF
jgi:opacity protein-like surface antigen